MPLYTLEFRALPLPHYLLRTFLNGTSVVILWRMTKGREFNNALKFCLSRVQSFLKILEGLVPGQHHSPLHQYLKMLKSLVGPLYLWVLHLWVRRANYNFLLLDSSEKYPEEK